MNDHSTKSDETGRKTGEKHARILDAAVVEIARQGYHRTTVARIARRAFIVDSASAACSFSRTSRPTCCRANGWRC